MEIFFSVPDDCCPSDLPIVFFLGVNKAFLQFCLNGGPSSSLVAAIVKLTGLSVKLESQPFLVEGFFPIFWRICGKHYCAFETSNPVIETVYIGLEVCYRN